MPKEISSLGDLLHKKADDIDDAGVKDDVYLIQKELDRNFSNQVSVQSVQDNGTITVKTRSSSMASELRLRQHSILQNLRKSSRNKLEKFRIIIG